MRNGIGDGFEYRFYIPIKYLWMLMMISYEFLHKFLSSLWNLDFIDFPTVACQRYNTFVECMHTESRD